jgi:hypothetical protein
MKTLEEHNRDIFNSLANTYPQPNGIECPECKKELMDLDAYVLCSHPPKKNIGCDCGYRGYRNCY